MYAMRFVILVFLYALHRGTVETFHHHFLTFLLLLVNGSSIVGHDFVFGFINNRFGDGMLLAVVSNANNEPTNITITSRYSTFRTLNLIVQSNSVETVNDDAIWLTKMPLLDIDYTDRYTSAIRGVVRIGNWSSKIKVFDFNRHYLSPSMRTAHLHKRKWTSCTIVFQNCFAAAAPTRLQFCRQIIWIRTMSLLAQFTMTKWVMSKHVQMQ